MECSRWKSIGENWRHGDKTYQNIEKQNLKLKTVIMPKLQVQNIVSFRMGSS